MDQSPATTQELEANLDYILNRSIAINNILDALERFDLKPPHHVELAQYLNTELIINETERQVFTLDLARARQLARDNN